MKVKINETHTDYEGFVRVERARLQFEKFNGEMSEEFTRHRYHRADAVAVLIFDEATRRVLLIKQFRFAVFANNGDGWLMECVAGMVEPGETPSEVAFREVEEETGLRLRSAELLTRYFFSPGGCSDQVHLYLGQAQDPSHPLGIAGLAHEGEEIEAQWAPLDDALGWIDEGRIVDGKTIIGLLLLERRLRQTPESRWSR